MKKVGKVLLGAVLTFSLMSGMVSAAEVKEAKPVIVKAVEEDVPVTYVTLKVGEKFVGTGKWLREIYFYGKQPGNAIVEKKGYLSGTVERDYVTVTE